MGRMRDLDKPVPVVLPARHVHAVRRDALWKKNNEDAKIIKRVMVVVKDFDDMPLD